MAVDPEAACGILAVGDRDIDLVRLDDVLEVVGDDPAAGRTEYVADKENVH